MAPSARVDLELDDLLVRPGTYFNPQTEVVVVVDDSVSIDQEVFNMEAFEGADWVRVSDEVPVDSDALDTAMERFQTDATPGSGDSASRRRRSSRTRTTYEDHGARTSSPTPTPRGGEMALLDREREDAVDFMADYPGFGEMRWYTECAGLRAGLVQLALDAARHRR